jgi:hypothetical protein
MGRREGRGRGGTPNAVAGRHCRRLAATAEPVADVGKRGDDERDDDEGHPRQEQVSAEGEHERPNAEAERADREQGEGGKDHKADLPERGEGDAAADREDTAATTLV